MGFLVYFILLALAAEVLGTVGGFGSSLFFVPIAGLFFDFHSVLAITAIFHLSSNISKIVLFINGIDKKLLVAIGIPSVVFVIAGAWLTRFLDNTFLEVLLSVFLIGLSLLLLVFRKFAIKPNYKNCFIGGSISGTMAGLLGTGGAIRGIVLTAFNLKKEVFLATSAAVDLAIDLSRSLVYFANGFVHSHDLYLVPILIAVSIIGTFFGKKILLTLSQANFKTLVLALILAVGIFTLIKQLFF